MIRIFSKRKTIRLITILTLFIFNASLSFAGQYKVTRVIDGNTIRVISYGTKTTVRLVGIDAPEVAHSKNTPGQPFSEAAAKHLAGLVLNKTVEILDTKAYWQAEEEARAAKRGMWRQGNYMSPMKRRKTHQN
jgi:endonuclease YncB( thermonuclease family)